jgi:hypothetical protein
MMHGGIWACYATDSYQVPSARPLTLSSYVVFPVLEADVKHLAIGSPMPDMPLFIESDRCYPWLRVTRRQYSPAPCESLRVNAPTAIIAAGLPMLIEGPTGIFVHGIRCRHH